MVKKAIIFSWISFLVVVCSVASVSAAGRDEFPRLDWATGHILTPEEALNAIQQGLIDHFKNVPPHLVGHIPKSWHLSKQQSFDRTRFNGLFINCRNYTPDGTPLIPLNITEFRYALHLLIGCNKTGWIPSDDYVRTDTIFPYYNLYWYKRLEISYDPVQAYKLLTSAGFDNSTGVWIMPNGQELRQIYVMSPIESPIAVMLTGKCVDSWNKFFGVGSTGEKYFVHYPLPGIELLMRVNAGKYDIAYLAWIFGKRDPDYLYDMFHPNGSANVNGLNLPISNDYLYAIRHWRWPNGTFITSFAEMREIVKAVQDILFTVTPVIPLYWTGWYINAYAPDLKCWIESPGFSSNNFWTYNWITWAVPPLSPGWRFHIPSPLESLNPVTSTSRSSWQILDLVIDSLIQINPFTHEHVLWAVKSWYPLEGYEPFTEPTEPNVIHGMKVTLELRPGIRWHDNKTVNAATIKYNLDFIKQIKPPRLENVWKTYLRSIVHEPPNDKITIYINGTETGFWPIYEYFKAALLVPPHIYCPYGPVDANQDGIVTYDEVAAFKPWQTPHPWALDMTCLIGIGPWIFKGWDALTNTIQLVEYTRYFARIFLREDVNFDGVVDMGDIGIALRSYGATPNHPKWKNGQSDVNCDYKVDMTDIGMILRKYGRITLPR